VKSQKKTKINNYYHLQYEIKRFTILFVFYDERAQVTDLKKIQKTSPL